MTAQWCRDRVHDRKKGGLDFLFAEQPELRKRLADSRVEIITSASLVDFAKFIGQETQRWEKVIKDANIVAD